jgi:hypothetical protein
MVLSGIGKGGPMKDRRTPRGGAKNEQKELLEEADEESYVCTKCGIGQDIFTRECLNCGALGTVIVDESDMNKEGIGEHNE